MRSRERSPLLLSRGGRGDRHRTRASLPFPARKPWRGPAGFLRGPQVSAEHPAGNSPIGPQKGAEPGVWERSPAGSSQGPHFWCARPPACRPVPPGPPSAGLPRGPPRPAPRPPGPAQRPPAPRPRVPAAAPPGGALSPGARPVTPRSALRPGSRARRDLRPGRAGPGRLLRPGCGPHGAVAA